MAKEKEEFAKKRLQQTLDWIQALTRNIEYRQDYELLRNGQKHDLDLMTKYGISHVVDPRSPVLRSLLVRSYDELGNEMQDYVRGEYDDFFVQDWAVDLVPYDRNWIREDKDGKAVLDFKAQLEHERYILLRIDLTKNKDRIMFEVEDCIDDHVQYVDKPDGRNKPDAKINRYLVWDEFISLGSLKKVARKYYVDESTVRKAYYRAVRDITGEQYDPAEHNKRQIQKEQLRKYCSICDERDRCIDPCPLVFGYADKDKVGQHDTTITDLMNACEKNESSSDDNCRPLEEANMGRDPKLDHEQSLIQRERMKDINQLLGSHFDSFEDMIDNLTNLQKTILSKHPEIFG